MCSSTNLEIDYLGIIQFLEVHVDFTYFLITSLVLDKGFPDK